MAKSATSQHSASPKAPTPRLEFLKQEEKVADRPLHPSPRLELFSRFVRCSRGNFTLRLGVAQAARGDRRRDQQSCTRGLCIFACVPRYKGTFFLLISARMMPLPIWCCTSLCPKTNMLPRSAQLLCPFGRAVVDASLPKVYKLQLPVIAQGRCGCLSSGP